MHSTSAWPTPISPRASGRDRFAGCMRSASRSAMSFRTYTALDTRQKAANSASTSPTSLSSSQPCPKTRPAKTNPFLIHWCGRIRRMSALAKGSVLRRARRRAEVALAEIAAALRQVPGDGVIALARGLQHPLAVRDRPEIRPVAGVLRRGLAQDQDVPAVEPPEIGEDVVVPRVRGRGAEYDDVAARVKGRDRRH